MAMRVAIATRIFTPESSAASFRLQALAETLSDASHEVTVYTVTSRDRDRGATNGPSAFTTRRFPVIRDRSGYVRGYVQYLSFDVPLLFRLLFARRLDVIVVEPPPTSWLVVRLVAGLRRTPFITYAADIWSDASESTGAPAVVSRALRWMEKRALVASRGVLAVNKGVADRVLEFVPTANVTVVGNGVDTNVFTPDGPRAKESPYLLYAGTASEWQGADVFIRAVALLKQRDTNVEVVFLGQGTAMKSLQNLAQSLDAPVTFLDPVPPVEAASWLRGAVASLASIRPGLGYDLAFPTKIYAAWATGVPVLYAGPGPAREVLDNSPMLGSGVDHDAEDVARAIEVILDRRSAFDHNDIAQWARRHASLRSVAERAAAFIEKLVARVER